jgi:hypothetical protein
VQPAEVPAHDDARGDGRASWASFTGTATPDRAMGFVTTVNCGATHLYAHVFKHKELGASKKPLTLVTDGRKSAILHRQILATHPSDVVGI